MNALLRIVLIAVVAILSGPRVGLTAEGDWTVICDGVTGETTRVLFDFETGAPVEPTVVIETCDFCLILDTSDQPLLSARTAEPLSLILRIALNDRRVSRDEVFVAGARAPPVPVET